MCAAQRFSDSHRAPPGHDAGHVLLSIIVPALNEAEQLPGLLDDLRAFTVVTEVIVADGGSDDRTRAIAEGSGARVLQAARGRGNQLAAAADAANGRWLLALHADVRLDARARDAVERAVRAGAVGAYALRLRIAARGARFRLVEIVANLRSRWLRLPYGDQGLLLPRALYDAAGGYPPIPLMEDVAIIRAVRARAPVRLLDAAVLASARRWQRDGILRRSIRNWRLLRAFNRGADPWTLAARYEGRASAPDRRGSPRRGASEGAPR